MHIIYLYAVKHTRHNAACANLFRGADPESDRPNFVPTTLYNKYISEFPSNNRPCNRGDLNRPMLFRRPAMKIENKIFRNRIELNDERKLLRRKHDQTRLDGKRIYVRSGSTYRDHEQRFSVRITLGKDWKKERAPSQTVSFDQSKSCGRKERPRYCSSFS